MLCGTGRVTINPACGHSLAGYGTVPNTGVHDDLAVTALHLDDGQRRVCLLNFDLIALPAPLNRQIREAVGRAVDLPPDAVFLAATHTHSGPEVRACYYGLGAIDAWRPDYNERLPVWAAEAAVQARRESEPCDLAYNFACAAENMNRRYSFPDRRHLYIPDNKQLAGRSAEYVDRELGLLVFRCRDSSHRYKAVLTNYGAHPLCVGLSSSLVSADYQGALRRTVEETFAGCRCLSTTGAAGDQHPLLPEGGFAEAQRMGAALGSLAVARCYDAVPVDESAARLRLARRDLELRVKDAFTRAMYPCQQQREHIAQDMGQRAVLAISVFALGIGPVLLAGAPGELASSLGAAAKWASPFLKTFVLGQATDDIGYIVSRNHYLWGGMEASSTPLAAGEGERIVQAVVETAGELLAADPLCLPAVG